MSERSESGSNQDLSNPAEAARFDKGKLRMELVPAVAMEALARVFGNGADKYGDFNWQKGLPWLQPYASCMRHMLAWWEGEDNDQESGLPHLYHALANVTMLLEYAKKRKGRDNRLYLKEREWLREREKRS